MATIIISWLFLVVVVVVGIQYMKANPTKNKSSYIVEGLLIGFFTGELFSMAFLDWNWLGAGIGIGQFLGTVIGAQIPKKDKKQ